MLMRAIITKLEEKNAEYSFFAIFGLLQEGGGEGVIPFVYEEARF